MYALILTLVLTDLFPPERPVEHRSAIIRDVDSHTSAKTAAPWQKWDPITHVHEVSHFIHHEQRLPGKQALYLLDNKLVYLDIPRLKLEQVQPFVPEKLRGHRYQTYVVKQATSRWENVNGTTMFVGSHNNNPLYLLDEHISYNNGAAAGLEYARLKINPNKEGTTNDLLLAPLEMTVYTLALCAAIKKHDPAYFKNKKFRGLIKGEVERSARLYREGQTYSYFKWPNTIMDDLKTSPLKSIADELDVRLP